MAPHPGRWRLAARLLVRSIDVRVAQSGTRDPDRLTNLAVAYGDVSAAHTDRSGDAALAHIEA